MLAASGERAAQVLALEDALKTLSELDQRKSKMVELRFFGGLSIEETAEVFGVSSGTVRRDWTLVKAWLQRERNNAN
jgi:RNA polymerase sigma factor (sigma-70 family)